MLGSLSEGSRNVNRGNSAVTVAHALFDVLDRWGLHVDSPYADEILEPRTYHKRL